MVVTQHFCKVFRCPFVNITVTKTTTLVLLLLLKKSNEFNYYPNHFLAASKYAMLIMGQVLCFIKLVFF